MSGDLRVGGLIQATFTSSWTGPGRIDVCEAPRHLVLTLEPGTEDEAQIEASAWRERWTELTAAYQALPVS